MNGEIYFEEMGVGRPVLLLHCLPGRASHFLPLATELARDHRVLMADNPGYGRSAALPAPYSLELANDRIRDALLGRGVTELAIVGHSLGAWRALGLALSPALRVRSVVLLGGLGHLPDEARAGYLPLADVARRSLAEAADAMVPGAFAPGFLERHPEVERETRSWVTEAPRDTFVGELEAVARLPDLRPRLGALAAPVVARVGSADLFTPPALSQAVVDAVPHGRLELVPDCGHMPLFEDRAATIASIARALREARP